jgi:hypothetical protein
MLINEEVSQSELLNKLIEKTKEIDIEKKDCLEREFN